MEICGGCIKKKYIQIFIYHSPWNSAVLHSRRGFRGHIRFEMKNPITFACKYLHRIYSQLQKQDANVKGIWRILYGCKYFENQLTTVAHR